MTANLRIAHDPGLDHITPLCGVSPPPPPPPRWSPPITGRSINPEQFRAYLTLRGLSDNTIRTYSSFYCRWWGHPGGDGWTDVTMWTPAGVRAWARTLPGSRSSLEQARTVVARACEAEGITDDLPSAIVVPRAAKKRHTRALAEGDVATLHTAAEGGGIKGLAVLVGLYTAARRSEIASLAWDRVDFDGREVTLWRPKNRDLHTVPMHPTLRFHLGLNRIDGDRWVFPGRHGGHAAPATIWRWCKDVAEDAGVEGMTTHRLRHTCLTEIVDRTGDLRAAQDIAGHSSPTVTSLYTRASEVRKRDAIGSLGGAYGHVA